MRCHPLEGQLGHQNLYRRATLIGNTALVLGTHVVDFLFLNLSLKTFLTSTKKGTGPFEVLTWSLIEDSVVCNWPLFLMKIEDRTGSSLRIHTAVKSILRGIFRVCTFNITQASVLIGLYCWEALTEQRSCRGRNWIWTLGISLIIFHLLSFMCLLKINESPPLSTIVQDS